MAPAAGAELSRRTSPRRSNTSASVADVMEPVMNAAPTGSKAASAAYWAGSTLPPETTATWHRPAGSDEPAAPRHRDQCRVRARRRRAVAAQRGGDAREVVEQAVEVRLLIGDEVGGVGLEAGQRGNELVAPHPHERAVAERFLIAIAFRILQVRLATEENLHARDELPHRKWLAQIVIRPDLETEDSIDFFTARTYGPGNLPTPSPFLPAQLVPCFFLAPLAGMVPPFATAPVLVLVGAAMFKSVAQINFIKIEEGLPAFLTIILIPLTFSITQGILWGFISHVGLYLIVGRRKEIHPVMYVLALVSIGLLVLEHSNLSKAFYE